MADTDKRDRPPRGLLFAIRCSLFAVLLLAGIDAASAQNYPWCAEGIKGGARTCGFVSFQQCMASLVGNTGYCDQNPLYRPATNGTARSRRAR